ncbi:hypothetical protein C2S52_004824 [Perilla frutescens var. hirtella]|nr:hypothetical protein C2S52_004824 [Perilla frutescens var. hirtella]
MAALRANPYMMYPSDSYQCPSYHPFMPSHHGFSYGSPPQIPPKLTRIFSKDGESTPSSGQGSSPPRIKSINLEANFDVEVEQNVTQQKRVRWTPKENDVLARCWVNISENSVVGTDQKLYLFWIRVNQGWGSGDNDQDILMEALKKWEHNHNGKSFKLLGMWQILRDCPKWNNPRDRDHRGKKKMKTLMSGAYTSSSNNDDDVEERVRPIGPKEGRNEQLKYHNKVSEWYILTKDTSGMNSTALLAHNIMVEEIKKK